MNEDSLTLLKERLLKLGANDGELDGIITDISGIITEKILADYVASLSTEKQEEISKLEPSEFINFINLNKTSLPPINENRCRAIADETWADYFQSMQNNK
jgi:hypothetical protein